MEVRDPIHGAILVTDAERPIVDHPFLQRLRNIKQVGFSELAFPGAGHTRYLHSVGVMHLAGRAFDSAFQDWEFSSQDVRAQYRQCVRLAALLHDAGHAPFSHCTEFAMPPLQELDIGVYRPEVLAARGQRRATHEDYTIGILTQSSLERALQRGFAFSPVHVAALISREVQVRDDFFVDGGLDFRVVLSQIISSELDVDRMDYLVRDSYFSGADYGKIDTNWILSNLTVHAHEGRVSLALDRRALYAFDDFMVARYHMFVMVYFHHKSVVYEEMLKRYFQSPDCDYRIPSDMEAYLELDDIHLYSHLRQSANTWAQDVCHRRDWKRVVELHGTPEECDLTWATALLDESGIDHLSSSAVGKLSRYTVFGQKRSLAPPIWVISDHYQPKRTVKSLHQATAIFEKYQDERRIARIYVAPDNRERAMGVLGVRG